MSRFWKDAATVFLVRRSDSARHHSKIKSFNYKILMLERSSKSSFMPNAYVFPGGTLSKGDLSTSWVDILQNASSYKSVKDVTAYGLPFFPQEVLKERAPALTVNDEHLPRDVAFRICGVRETFEETGILIGQTLEGLNDLQLNASALREWRDEVNKDDAKFMQMCKTLKVIPDIWSLHEYCNWLTPTNLTEVGSKKRRFDTIFYVTFMEQTIEAAHDDQEIIASKWYHPYDLIEDHYAEKLWLAPPQLYELLRLFAGDLGDYDKLKSFVKTRSTKSIDRWLPVRINCRDGIISVLPGDELFPENPDYEGVEKAPELPWTVDEARQRTERHNRVEIKSLHGMIMVCNIDTGYGHTNPAAWPVL